MYVFYHENAYGKHHNWHVSDSHGFYKDNTKYIAYAPDAESLCPYSNGISFRTNKSGVGWVSGSSRFRVDIKGERKALIKQNEIFKLYAQYINNSLE